MFLPWLRRCLELTACQLLELLLLLLPCMLFPPPCSSLSLIKPRLLLLLPLLPLLLLLLLLLLRLLAEKLPLRRAWRRVFLRW